MFFVLSSSPSLNVNVRKDQTKTFLITWSVIKCSVALNNPIARVAPSRAEWHKNLCSSVEFGGHHQASTLQQQQRNALKFPFFFISPQRSQYARQRRRHTKRGEGKTVGICGRQHRKGGHLLLFVLHCKCVTE